MNIIITDRCKVWDIKESGNVSEVKFSCSRKVKEDDNYDKVQITNGVAKNGYIATYYSFVRFVGHARNKLANVYIGDTITHLEGKLEREPYWDSNTQSVVYPKNYKLTIFDFEIYDENNSFNNQNKNLDKAPQVEDAPVDTTKVMEEENTKPAPKAEDVCPF